MFTSRNLPGPVAIVGAGAVGTAFAHAFSEAGIVVTAIASRNGARASKLAVRVGAQVASFGQVCKDAPVVLLAITDSAIEEVCGQLEPSPANLVAHASGFRDISALEPIRESGAMLGGLHPLAAIARSSRPLQVEEIRAIFKGAAFAVEGDEHVRTVLHSLALAIGGHPFDIDSSDKPGYHLAASMLAAFSAGLAQVLWNLMRQSGASTDVASAGTGHLLETVGQNIARAETPVSVATGPIARADVAGVARQARTAAELSPDALSLYRVHAAHSIQLARASGRIDEHTSGRMLAAIDEVMSAGTR